LTLRYHPIFASHSDSSIVPSEFANASDQKNIVEIADLQNWELSDQYELLYRVQQGATVTIQLTIGASVDATKALNKFQDNAFRAEIQKGI
jgi:hypothetical protein